jgi:hypothetical protein
MQQPAPAIARSSSEALLQSWERHAPLHSQKYWRISLPLYCIGDDILQGELLLWKLSIFNVIAYQNPISTFGPFR